MPSQFRNRGDRLVFSNGVVVLAGLAAVLIWAFDANLTRLIQLYVVGVFTAFTLSQAGMVRRWMRTKEGAWQRSAVINGVGAATTGIVLVVVTITKFAKGAWIVIVAMPFIVLFFWAVHRHYEHVAAALKARRLTGRDAASGTMLLLVPDLGPGDARCRGLPARGATGRLPSPARRCAGVVRGGRRRVVGRRAPHGRPRAARRAPTATSCVRCGASCERSLATSASASSPS